MKLVELKTLAATDKLRPLNYKQAIMDILGAAPMQGLNIAEVRRSVKFMDKVEGWEDGTTIELDDDDHSYLVMRLNAHAWGLANSHIVQFVDDIEHAKAREA